MPVGQPSELDARPQSRREWSGWLGSLVLPLALVTAIIGVLLYLRSDSGQPASGSFGTIELPAAQNVTQQAPLATAGRAAPNFSLEKLAGEPTRLSDLQGRPVVVNFWASWCSTCRAGMPDLISAFEEHGSDGLVILAVNVGEASERAAAFAIDFDLPFAILLDTSGEVARTWNVDASNQELPWSYFVDKNGVVQMVIQGAMTSDTLAEGLALILSEGN